MVTKFNAFVPEEAAQPEAQQPQAASTSRVHGEVTRFAFGTEAAETSTKLTTYAHTTAGASGGSVLASLDRQGKSQSVELVPGVPSSRTDVAVALREGLLVRDAAGNLQDAPDAAQKVEAMQAGPKEEQPQTDPGAGVFNPEHDSIWNSAIADMSQPAYDAAIAAGIAATIGQGDATQIAKALAANAGLEPEQANELVGAGIDMYTQVVERALAPLGLEGERLDASFEWMRSQPAKLQDALGRLLHGRDVGGFLDLAKDFRVARPDPAQVSMFKAAGMESRVDRDTGDLMVRAGQGRWRRGSDILKGAPAAPAVQARAPAAAPATPASQRKVIDPATGETVSEAQFKAWGY